MWKFTGADIVDNSFSKHSLKSDSPGFFFFCFEKRNDLKKNKQQCR